MQTKKWRNFQQCFIDSTKSCKVHLTSFLFHAHRRSLYRARQELYSIVVYLQVKPETSILFFKDLSIFKIKS